MVEAAHRLPSKSGKKKKFPADDRAAYSLNSTQQNLKMAPDKRVSKRKGMYNGFGWRNSLSFH